MATRTLGAQVSHMLKDRGIDTIFGVPGVHNQELYRGLTDTGITHVLARHEQGAGFMADGYARATGRPGVAYVITGPGLCNIMTPMGQAYSDNVPMLVISSCLDDTSTRRGQLHQMKDQRAAAASVCAWSHEARDAAAAYTLIDRALVAFETHDRRPCHIQIPMQQLASPAPPFTPMGKNTFGAGKPVIAQTQIAQGLEPVVERLMAAKRPLFILGRQVAQEGMQGAVGRMLDRFGAAAFVTFGARGVLAPDQPRFFGSYLARPDSAATLGESDCVVVLGSDLAETDFWRADPGLAPGTVIHVHTDADVLAASHPDDLRVRRDPLDFVFQIGQAGNGTPHAVWDHAQISATRDRWRAQVEGEYPGIAKIVLALRDALPARTAIYSDMTQFAYVAQEVWDMDAPDLWHHPNGFGTLGYALPAAIGGAIGRDGQPTVAIAGDYGFQYTLQELMVAVELELSLPVVIWDNCKLGAIADSMASAQISQHATSQTNPDFIKLAEAYGAAIVVPQTIDAISGAVSEALARRGPTLIQLRADILTSS